MVQEAKGNVVRELLMGNGRNPFAVEPALHAARDRLSRTLYETGKNVAEVREKAKEEIEKHIRVGMSDDESEALQAAVWAVIVKPVRDAAEAEQQSAIADYQRAWDRAMAQQRPAESNSASTTAGKPAESRLGSGCKQPESDSSDFRSVVLDTEFDAVAEKVSGSQSSNQSPVTSQHATRISHPSSLIPHQIEAIQSSLTTGWALLDFFQLGDEFAVFVITPERCWVERLEFPTEEYSEAIKGLVDWWGLDVDLGKEPSDRALWTLHRRLFAPLRDKLKCAEVEGLYLVPHGALHIVPLHASCRGRRGEQMYLGDEFHVVTLPVATLLPQLSRPVGTWNNAALLALCNPNQNTPHALPFSEWEAERLRASFNGSSRVFTGREASVPTLEKHWDGTSLAYFSCHGSNGGGQAFLAHLQLSDGALLAHDIAYRLSPLPQGSGVVLNGCETGAKDIRALDEAMGLTTAFLLRGASVVLSTHYSVIDIVASLLMDTFTQEMRRGTPPTLALRAAQKKVRAMTVGEAVEHSDKVRAYVKEKVGEDSYDARKVEGQLMRLYRRAGDVGAALACLPRIYRKGGESAMNRAKQRLQSQAKGNPDYDKRAFDHPYYWSAFHLSGRMT